MWQFKKKGIFKKFFGFTAIPFTASQSNVNIMPNFSFSIFKEFPQLGCKQLRR